MKWFKNSIALASLLALFFWSVKDSTFFEKNNASTSQTVHSIETIKVIGTKQSIAEHQFQSVVKESSSFLISFLPFICEENRTFFLSKFTSFLSRQDHNRCEKVSKLLFPYH
ncbi:MAG: hypothetical protein KDC50_06570, partial [Flavobacterium sp.]|nr:hypothetical protein [Flavobacterium sp.]